MRASELLTGPLRSARMGGSSIAGPSAVGWVTDFLNAAYHARPAASRDVDDVRLAFAVLTTFWHRLGRRLALRDLRAFDRAFGGYRRERLRRRRSPTLDRDELLSGGDALLGPGFADGYADPARTGWGIVFRDARERAAHVPELRLRHAALGSLTPPRRPPHEQRWHTYAPVGLPSVQAALAALSDVPRWPEFGASLGRFTGLRSGSLEGQSFEIEVMAAPVSRTPLYTRGYVTVTRLLTASTAPDRLESYVDDLRVAMERADARGDRRPMPGGATPRALIELTTHEGHFIGRAVSRLLLFEHDGGAFVRDIGSWDPLAPHLALPYRLGGHRAQVSFWGGGRPEESLLHQLALRAAERPQ